MAYEPQKTDHFTVGLWCTAYAFDLAAMTNRPFGYQRLDQLTFDLLTGVR
jgi:hypothetical protein